MPLEPSDASLDDESLAALLGSRLCHDLISPLGAIGNGVELLALSGQQLGPEMELIAQSVEAANARVKFFRVAFGQAGHEQRLGHAEISGLLDGMFAQGRITVDWQISGDLPRAEVKLAFLAILCLETLLPFGGILLIAPGPKGWVLSAQSEKSKPQAAPWEALNGGVHDITPAHVQFALLPREMARLGRSLSWEIGEAGGTIRL
ncbi:histidine phosphotransferase [Thioclava sp. BHET1]|nr:histidine phosphotransferase [Thioclava sp. BHET1]